MLSTHARLKARQGKHGTPRLQYLQSLVVEFQANVLSKSKSKGRSKAEEEKERIVANLANFAYDPINYEYFRQLNILELFLDCLPDPDDAHGKEEGGQEEGDNDEEEEEDLPSERLTEFAMGGLCNAAADPANAAAIMAADGVRLVAHCLEATNSNTVLSAIGCLYFLCSVDTVQGVATDDISQRLREIAASDQYDGKSKRLRNAARAFFMEHAASHRGAHDGGPS